MPQYFLFAVIIKLVKSVWGGRVPHVLICFFARASCDPSDGEYKALSPFALTETDAMVDVRNYGKPGGLIVQTIRSNGIQSTLLFTRGARRRRQHRGTFVITWAQYVTAARTKYERTVMCWLGRRRGAMRRPLGKPGGVPLHEAVASPSASYCLAGRTPRYV